MIWNLAELELRKEPEPQPNRDFRGRSLTEEAGAKLTGLAVYEIPAGHKSWPYHFELAEEEWLVVVEGEVVLRTPEGERTLRAGDVACFPVGAEGAHAVRNESDASARFAMPSSQAKYCDGAVYPDSGKIAVRTRGFRHRGLIGDEVPYWDGES